MSTETDTNNPNATAKAAPVSIDIWISAMIRVAESFGKPSDPQYLRQQMRWFEHQPLGRQLERLSGLMGLHVGMVSWTKVRWRNEVLPAIIQLEQGGIAVIERLHDDGQADYWLNDGGDLLRSAELVTLLEQSTGPVFLVGVAARGRDQRIDEFVQPYKKHWFWDNFRGAGRKIAEISLASVIGNVLALTGILFSMQIYDRVIPAQS